MAVTVQLMSLIIGSLGTLSFIFGIIAENKKPAAGTPIPGKDVVICKYPSDPTVALGYLSFAFLVLSSLAGFWSLFYPYKGKSIPQSALFRSTSFVVFFNIAVLSAGLAAALLLWPTITEQRHLNRKVHHNLQTDCPTAKTGLLGGGAFVSFDSALFWLVSLLLADNAREDYFDEVEKDSRGEYGQALADDYDYDAPENLKGTA
ncbi:hypothetical protein JCGZ_06777 [Jatropha curcas]|uniref:Uncharacterized protein n=1 Tax=Jatropha curcas TaxID=180498 RepID=A0A067KQR8_JATCU|nr:uncharacterized protein LOC105634708 [Jatropha curcas]KDP37323.1 hypothetical protein JCGZ_06777 [Jatropha curcas]